MGTPVVGVLALQGGVAEHVAALERCGVTARPVRRAEELDGLHGIVLPGGESTTMTRLLDIFDLYEPLRERLADGLPAYGSCAGMIMLSAAVCDGGDGAAAPAVRPLGALDVTVRRNAFGRQVDSFETDLDFAGVDDPVHAVFIRAPWVDKIGDGVSVLATVPDGPDVSERSEAAGRIVAVQQGAVLATAFHPELVEGDERVHRYFVQIVRAR
ncbi:pyridoxal 5'-phosphate synthase glutaminase subunit PdxT [Saccharopolyspora griseoalba]|uniref:Pyridoxal 5'-phosphate synthase subunit PdxT n=1 Tax=Saccharopolyspora griseoalba TaxID=1431848 RepID=A0ABW2LR36_9PSEU